MVVKGAKENGAFDAVVSSHWSDGSAGAVGLADAVMKACSSPRKFQFLYDLNKPLEEKISKIAKDIYGAKEVEYTPQVKQKLEQYTKAVRICFVVDFGVQGSCCIFLGFLGIQ